MAKEITDIIEEIHEYFSGYNEFVSAEMGVMAEEIREAVYAINNRNFRIGLEKCDFVTEKTVEGGQCLAKIILPEIQVPELKLSLCKKTLTLEDSKINEICEKFKSMIKLRYFIDDDEIRYYSMEDEGWNRIDLRESTTKKKIEEVGEKIKTATNTAVEKVSKQKKIVTDLQDNITDALKKVVNTLELPMPCLLIRKNKINIGIEVKYPCSYDVVISKGLLLAQKVSMSEVLKVILGEMLQVVTDVKTNIEDILKEAVKVGVATFKETLISILKILSISDINCDYILCKGINETSLGKWVELKSDLSKSIATN